VLNVDEMKTEWCRTRHRRSEIESRHSPPVVVASRHTSDKIRLAGRPSARPARSARVGGGVVTPTLPLPLQQLMENAEPRCVGWQTRWYAPGPSVY
jgi:hypothetical protein